MSRVFAMARKDLRSTMRNLPALAMMLLAPLALAALLGFAFGGGEGFSITATKVVVANADEGLGGPTASPDRPAAGASVVNILKSPEIADILEVSEVPSAAAARKRVDNGTDGVAIVIPSGFSAATYGTGAATTTTVKLYENPTQGIGGDITESIVRQTLLTFNGARAAAAAAAGLVAAGDQGGQGDELAQRDDLAQRAAAQFIRDGGAAARVAISQRPPQLLHEDQAKDVSVTGVILAGMMVFFLFFGASNVARTILDEDQAGTFPRLFTTPTPQRTILAGKFTSVFVTVTLQAVVLLLAGRVLFGIDWGGLDVVAALTLVAATVASGLALLVISLVRTPAQAGAIGAGVYLVLALLGGNFVGSAPASTGTYATIQKLTPNGWLLRGWDTAMKGGGLADIGFNLMVPLLFALVFFVVAVWRFRGRYA